MVLQVQLDLLDRRDLPEQQDLLDLLVLLESLDQQGLEAAELPQDYAPE